MFLSLALFASLYYIENYAVFCIIAVISRIITGFGVGGFGSIADSYIPILYPDKVIKYIGIMETFLSLGLTTGASISGWLY